MNDQLKRQPIDFKQHDELWVALNAAEARVRELEQALHELHSMTRSVVACAANGPKIKQVIDASLAALHGYHCCRKVTSHGTDKAAKNG